MRQNSMLRQFDVVTIRYYAIRCCDNSILRNSMLRKHPFRCYDNSMLHNSMLCQFDATQFDSTLRSPEKQPVDASVIPTLIKIIKQKNYKNAAMSLTNL